MELSFEWDQRKAEANLIKHGASFKEAITIFGDILSVTRSDPDHSQTEARYITMGMSIRHRILVVVHADRGDKVRLISARPATRAEQRNYEKTN